MECVGNSRVPGFPLFLAVVFRLQHNYSHLLPIILLNIIGSLAVIPIWLAANLWDDKKNPRLAIIATTFYAFNLTAIANAPMMLSDTLFLFGTSWQLYFFLLMWKRKKNRMPAVIATGLIAGLNSLIRPINVFWFIPFATAILIMPNDSKERYPLIRKLFSVMAGVAIFAAAVTPWMLRNLHQNSGFTLDTNAGSLHYQNGAMILAKAEHGDFETMRAKLIADEEREFSDREKYNCDAARESYRKKEFLKIIAAHPWIWISGHFTPYILFPDAPTMLELLGITTENRGTMGILARDGLLAAVKHYFSGEYHWLFILLPFLAITLFMYLGTFATLVVNCLNHGTHGRYGILFFLLFIEYYLFLPGPITAPRYQLPALPLMSLMAAEAMLYLKSDLFKRTLRKREKQPGK